MFSPKTYMTKALLVTATLGTLATVGAGTALATGPAAGAEISVTSTAELTRHQPANAAALAPLVEGTAHPARVASAANFVKVNQALLRSQPNTRSTKLDVANAGNGVDLYCWVPSEGGGGPVWFRAHFWGGRYTGWIRSDLVQWNSYPAPYQC